MFDGKLENSELRGCTKLEKIEYIKEIPAPGILIFGTLYVLFLCMGWVEVTDFILFIISFVIIIMIDRRSTLRRGTKKIKNIYKNLIEIKMKMKRGELVGFNRCLGYDLDKETGELKIIESEAETVRHIFDRYLQGAGGTVIARELNEEGILTYNNCK